MSEADKAKAMARLMGAVKSRLDANAHKGSSWKGMGAQDIIARMMEELAELNDAVEDGVPEDIIREAADVAAFAMFLIDNVDYMYSVLDDTTADRRWARWIEHLEGKLAEVRAIVR